MCPSLRHHTKNSIMLYENYSVIIVDHFAEVAVSKLLSGLVSYFISTRG